MGALGNKTETKHVIVVGGSGFVGTHLTKKLVELNYKVTILDIVSPHPSTDEMVEFEYCDVRNPISVKLSSKPDILINLAAVHRNPGHEISEYYLTNALGALNLCKWSNQNRIPRNIFVSSISVYGDGPTLEEEVKFAIERSHYGFSKLMAENIYLENIFTPKNNLTIFRPAVIFGEGEAGNFTRLANALIRKRFIIPSTEPVIKPCGYVKDFVDAITFSLNRPTSKTFYNFAFPNSYTIRDICQSFHEVGDVKLPPRLPLQRIMRFFVEKFPGNFTLARISKLLSGQAVVPLNLILDEFEWRYELNDALLDWKTSSNFDSPS
jgi:nucleoside-diphosphate-sugar epimerase